jgi:hypothetical protein
LAEGECSLDIDSIFTGDVICRLESHRNDSDEIQFRLEVLNSSKVQPSSPTEAWRLTNLTRKRALWERWVDAASRGGLFDGNEGIELRSRLAGVDDNGFRSAIAECMVAWAFSDDLGLRISPRPAGRGGSVLEFLVQAPSQEIHVEVKSPRNLDELTKPEGGAVDVGAPATALARALESAAKQFNEGAANVLVLAFPETGAPIPAVSCKPPELSLIPAFYGEHTLLTRAGGPTVSAFDPKGRFLRPYAGQPRFTRVSAIVCIDDVPPYEKLQAVVLHNPHAIRPVEPKTFGDWRQLVPDPNSGAMRWTYGQVCRA